MDNLRGALVAAIWLSVAAYPANTKTIPTPSELDLAGPWQSPNATIVLDPYHENQYTIADLQLDPRIVAIIHKATEGDSVIDDKYFERMAAAVKAGYLWGSYHVGRSGSGKAQADRYYHWAKPRTQDVMALDLEEGSDTMTMAEAANFVRELHAKTGRYPVLYGGRNTLARPTSATDIEILRHCPLWLVSTRQNDPSTYRDAYQKVWPRYALWQFSSELRYRYPIRSAGKVPVDWTIDVNYYAGTREQLRRAWPRLD